MAPNGHTVILRGRFIMVSEDLVPAWLQSCIQYFESQVAPINANDRKKLNQSCKEVTESSFPVQGPLTMCSYSRMSVPGVYPLRGSVEVSG